jgi:glycosyltransferase involved in cell wall biosynthesis
MDICVLNPFFYPHLGGTEKVLIELYKRLGKTHNVSVITGSLEKTSKESIDYIDGIKVIRLKSHYMKVPGAPLPFLVMDRIRSHIKKEHADIYHINNRYQYHLDVVNSIKHMNKKIAMTIHNALPKNINGIIDTTGLLYDIAWGRTLMRYADLITGVSENAVRTTVPKRYMEKAHVVYNGVDYKRYRHMSKKEKHVKAIIERLGFEGSIIFNNGRLVPQKGQAYLIKAFDRLLDDEYDVNLVIVGKGPMMEQFGALSKKLGIERNFKIIPEIEDYILPYYYNASDLFVLPSTYEPASVALLEGLATMTPCIASRVGGIPEMMGNCGFYIKPKSINQIYEKVIHSLNNQDEAKKKALEGRKRMIAEHDWDKIAKQYETLFSSLLRY